MSKSNLSISELYGKIAKLVDEEMMFTYSMEIMEKNLDLKN
jgi:hypothetical protein